MSEMATAPFGQVAISNQPSFHIPYLFRYGNYPDYTALLIKTLRQNLFTQAGEAYPGDEDNGSLCLVHLVSSWILPDLSRQTQLRPRNPSL